MYPSIIYSSTGPWRLHRCSRRPAYGQTSKPQRPSTIITSSDDPVRTLRRSKTYKLGGRLPCKGGSPRMVALGLLNCSARPCVAGAVQRPELRFKSRSGGIQRHEAVDLKVQAFRLSSNHFYLSRWRRNPLMPKLIEVSMSWWWYP